MIFTMKPLRELLASNIERVIKDSGYSIRDIAAALEVSETTVHRWKAEKNSIPPDVENMEALARFLNVEPVEFYKSEENVIPVYGNTPLRKYLIIPDSIIEDLSHFDHKDKVWDMIETAIRIQKEAKAKAQKA